jgi:hypothetical protein
MSALSGPALAGMSEGVAAVTVGDYQKAIAEFQPLAAGGDPAAQYQLARIYLEGHGPADGVAQGIDLMTKAANGGHPEAQAQLGLSTYRGSASGRQRAGHDWLSRPSPRCPGGHAAAPSPNQSRHRAEAHEREPAGCRPGHRQKPAAPAGAQGSGQQACSHDCQPAAAITTTSKTMRRPRPPNPPPP